MRASRPQIRYPSRPFGPSPLRPRAPSGRLAALGLASVFLAAVLAGCTGGSGGDVNQSPRAVLDATKDNGWTAEDFTFDAQDSEDPDGEIVRYRFDFGDGTTREVTEENEARVTHRYTRGGQFTVTLTVFDNGKDDTGSLSSDDSVTVVVNERVPIATMTLSNVAGANQTARGEQPFQVYDRANRYELNLTLRSALPSGSSEFEVRVVDPEGNTVGEPKTESVGPGTTGMTVTLDGLLTDEGVHRVVVEAKTGSGTANGELRVIYGEDLDG